VNNQKKTITKNTKPSTHRLPQTILRPIRDNNAFETTIEQLTTSVRLNVFIINQQLPPKQKLAKTLNINHTTLHKAITTLRKTKIIHTQHNRGENTMITYRTPSQNKTSNHTIDMTTAQIRNTLNFQRIVEPNAATLTTSQQLNTKQHS